jgi:hypothetical protein
MTRQQIYTCKTPKKLDWLNFFYNTMVNHASVLKGDTPLEEYLEKHLILVTMKSPFTGPSDLHEASQRGLKAFEFFYINLLRTVIGTRYRSTPGLQPFGPAFIDFEHTRTGRVPVILQPPHVHALLLLHPLNRSEFHKVYDQLADDPATKSRQGVKWQIIHPSISEVTIEYFDHKKGDLSRLISYCGKIGTLTGGWFDRVEGNDTFRFFPDITLKRITKEAVREIRRAQRQAARLAANVDQSS